MTKRAFIIGNGTSRRDLDLLQLKDQGTIFGCNALYRDFAPEFLVPDYLIAIDQAMIDEIRTKSNFPKDRFIEPPEIEKWEPIEMHWKGATSKGWNPVRPRSNAGMNAIIEAIKMGYDDLFLIGFDFLVVDKNQSISNIYDGTDCYGPATRCSPTDSKRRMNFLWWLIENNPDVDFSFCYPQEIQVYIQQRDNVYITPYKYFEQDFLKTQPWKANGN